MSIFKFTILGLGLVAHSALSLSLLHNERITILSDFPWPMSGVLRHLVFVDGDVHYDVYKQEISPTLSPDLVRRLHAAGADRLTQEERVAVRQVVAQENLDWYQRKIGKWIDNVEAEERGRGWPPEILEQIRQVVLERVHAVDYIVGSRRTISGQWEVVSTLRRLVSGEYYQGSDIMPIGNRLRLPLVAESIFQRDFHFPVIPISKIGGQMISGREISELGGYWIRDGEDKEHISEVMLALLVFFVSDPRTPLPYRDLGRHWLLFTDQPGHILFRRKFGFTPVAGDAPTQKWGDTNFYFDQHTSRGLRQRLLSSIPCGLQLAEAIDSAHRRLETQ